MGQTYGVCHFKLGYQCRVWYVLPSTFRPPRFWLVNRWSNRSWWVHDPWHQPVRTFDVVQRCETRVSAQGAAYHCLLQPSQTMVLNFWGTLHH